MILKVVPMVETVVVASNMVWAKIAILEESSLRSHISVRLGNIGLVSLSKIR
jgi:hypothetical protein